MKVDEISLNERVIQVLRNSGISELFPPQEEALKTGVLDGRSLIMAVPTSAGKTLVAEIAMLQAIVTGRGKALYLVPLRSLAHEKYQEFQKYREIGIATAMSVGDYDTREEDLATADIVVLTTERADSLIRHEEPWLEEVATVVVDEIHLINDGTRGPTLEMVLAKLRCDSPHIQVVGLSATIPNAGEVAEWLGADLVTSDWRPVPLTEGVLYGDRITFENLGTRRVPRCRGGDELARLVCEIIEDDGQVLVFVSSRRSTMAVARKLTRIISASLTREALETLAGIAERLVAMPSVPEMTRTLSVVLKGGVAFHHAGLASMERALVEDCFRRNLVKVIVATPTLAAGVNLPARRVVIRDYRRYSADRGYYAIPVLEYKQMAGRAGRPKYDEYGEALLLARTEAERDFLLDRYVFSEPEEIESQLASVTAIQSHVLSAIVTGQAHDTDGLRHLMGHTFFAYQMGVEGLDRYIAAALDFLHDSELIDSSDDGTLLATELGRLTSMLYIDPRTTLLFRDALRRAGPLTNLGVLHMVCASVDQPKARVLAGDSEDYALTMERHWDDFLVDPPDPFDAREEYLEFLSQLKTARILEDWVLETPERSITEHHNVGLGDLQRYVDSTKWLLHAASEIAGLLGASDTAQALRTLQKRVAYGIAPELLSLVRLRGVGRVRARVLYNHGFRTPNDLVEASLEELGGLPQIGTKIAVSIKKQVGGSSGTLGAEDVADQTDDRDTEDITIQTLLDRYI